MSDLNRKLGILLKKERERQNIKIDDLSERLKISVQYLQSIEKGTSDGLPSELYFSLFAKSYAEAIGIDYLRTVDAIRIDIEDENKKAEESKESNKSKLEGEASEQENPLFRKGGIAVAIILGLFIVYFGVNKFLLDSDKSDLSMGITTDPQALEESEASKKLDEEYKNYDWNDKEYKESSKIILTMTARKESWSAVFADGDTAIYRTLRVGKTYTAEADYRLTVSVGIPSAVTIKLNGQEVDLRNENSKRIYKVKIDQMNIDKFLKENQDEVENKLSLNLNANKQIVTSNDTVSTEGNNSN